MLQIGREDDEARDQLNKAVSCWIQRVLPLEEDDRPKAAVMRRQTLEAWKGITEELTRRRVLAHDANWRIFAVLWKMVENLIPYPENVKESPFPLLQRCGWRECLCSVHKPAHRLRVCKGCWLIAYCGSRCQMMDWERGGHHSAAESARASTERYSATRASLPWPKGCELV